MKATQICVVMYGHDAHLLETQRWVLDSRGYRVLTIRRPSDLSRLQQTPAPSLLVLCRTLSPREREDAVARARACWPEIKILALVRDRSNTASDVLGQVMHTLDVPARLLTTVGELVGYAGSSTYSHTY
jgi:hypothetical protein